MRADQIQDASELAGLTLRRGTTRIHEVHQGIAGRAFRRRVHGQLRRWLEQRPEGPRPDAPDVPTTS